MMFVSQALVASDGSEIVKDWEEDCREKFQFLPLSRHLIAE